MSLCRYVALAATIIVLAVSPLAAQWSPWVESHAVSPGLPNTPGELVVNGVVVLRLRTVLGGYSPERRAQMAADVLREAIAAGLKPADIQIDDTTEKGSLLLKALGKIVATANADEAKASGSTLPGLAQLWASILKQALVLPALTVPPGRVIIPLGETRIVRVGGVAHGPLSAAPAAENRVAFTVTPAAGEIALHGLSTGIENIVLSRDGASATLSVAVQDYAGHLDSPRPITVTGVTTPPEVITRYAVASVLTAAHPTTGAVLQVDNSSIRPDPLPAGQSEIVQVPIQMTGQDMIPVRTVAQVPVTNRVFTPVDTAALLYSNNPERITSFQTLFAGKLAPGTSATRLLYHHQSAMDKDCLFTVEFINESAIPASVQVVRGDAGPVIDTVWVGYRAGSQFMRDFLADVGAIVEVPARSRIALSAVRLPPGQTVSGIAQLRQLSGKPLLVRVGADIPGGPQTITAELLPAPDPWLAAGQTVPFALSQHVYRDPTKQVKVEYQPGGRWVFIEMGRSPLHGADDNVQLYGNYGVFYDINLTLTNPTSLPVSAEMLFETSAGLAGGVFWIDGRMVEIPQASAGEQISLAKYTLAPGARQTVLVRTFPLSGSSYPARLIVKPS